MGIFDNFKTEFGGSAVNKAKDVAEIAKITAQISQEELKLNSVYSDIGKKYIEIYGGNCHPEMAELVQIVLEGQSRIALYKETIKNIRGVSKCPMCGSEINKEDVFCKNCGHALPKQKVEIQQNNVRVCKKCNAPLQDGMMFCTSCGTRVQVANEVEPVPNYPVLNAYKAPQSVNEMNAEEQAAPTMQEINAFEIESIAQQMDMDSANIIDSVPNEIEHEDIISNEIESIDRFYEEHVQQENQANFYEEYQSFSPEEHPIDDNCSNPIPQEEFITYEPTVNVHDTLEQFSSGLSMFCSECGTRFEDDAMFCSECGARRQ